MTVGLNPAPNASVNLVNGSGTHPGRCCLASQSTRVVRAFEGVESVGTATPLRDEFWPVRHRTPDAQIAAATAFARNAIDWLATR